MEYHGLRRASARHVPPPRGGGGVNGKEESVVVDSQRGCATSSVLRERKKKEAGANLFCFLGDFVFILSYRSRGHRKPAGTAFL